MKLKGYLTIIFLGLVSPLRAQSHSEKEVMKVIVHLFDGMRQADTSAIRALFLPGAIMQTISGEEEGFGVIRNQNVNALVKTVGKETPGALDERIMFDMVRVDGQLASVWTPYLFNYNGSLSHCGVNSFQLVHTRNGWKINYLIDTRRTDKCGPSHLYK